MNKSVKVIVNNNYRLLELIYENQVKVLNETFAPIKQENMATELNLTRTTISNILKKLKEEELIEDYSITKKYKVTNIGEKIIKALYKIEKE